MANTIASFAIVAASSGVNAPAIDVPMKMSASRMASARPPVSLSGFVSSAYKDALAFVILLALLFVKPSGLFGLKDTKRV